MCETDLELQCPQIMIEQYLAIVSAMRQMVPEYQFTSQRDMAPELLPPREAGYERSLERLWVHD